MSDLSWFVAVNVLTFVGVVVYLWVKGAVLVTNIRAVVRELSLVVATNEAASALLLAHVENLARQLDRNNEGMGRMERNALGIAADLVKAQAKVDGVATDLAETHHRADQVGPGHAPGTASDAAVRTDPNRGR